MSHPREESASWYRFCQRSTYHGFSDIYQSKSLPERLCWVLLVLGATAATIFGSYSILKYYGGSPLLVSFIMRTSLERQLPDVAICPFNRFDGQFLAEHDISESLAEHIRLAYTRASEFASARAIQSRAEVKKDNADLLKFMGMHNWSFSDVLESSGLSCGDVIPYCYSPSKRGYYNCCKDSETVYSAHGKCFRLKGPAQLSSGYDFGITVVVAVPTAESTMNHTSADGISVRLAERNRGFGNDLSFIPTGVHALMPLRSVLYNFVNMPPRYKCLEGKKSGYFPQQCFDQCVFAEPQRICNCSHVATRHPSLAVCTPLQLSSCLFVEVKRMKSGTVFKDCRERCLPPCNYWEYYPTISYAYFPAQANLDYLNLRDMQHHIILNVFYERLEYPVIKHVHAMTMQQFIANIGGQLGLWVGGSVLTLAQIIIFLFQYSYKKLVEEKKNRPVDARGSIQGTGSRTCNSAAEFKPMGRPQPVLSPFQAGL